MNKKNNIICIVLIIIILAGFSVFKHYDSQKMAMESEEIRTLRTQYLQDAKAEEEEKIEKEKHYAAIREDIPGIVCWGDDITYGKGGINKSYPYVLENLLNDNDYKIPVYNNGVSGEDSLTVLGRVGAIPYQTSAFKIRNSPALIEIDVTSSHDNEKVNPLLRKRNPGVNPCTIAGVEGTLYGYILPAKLSEVNKFFFVRDNTGDVVDVPEGTEIITSGSKYKDYINILAVGDNGGYIDDYDLLKQNQQFVKFLKGSKNAESYLILGRYKGNAEDNELIEKLMEDSFGNNYINIREYFSTNALKDMNLNPTEEDKKAMEVGSVPPSFLNDEGNFNDTAYDALGKLVYNRLVNLNFVKK